MAEFLSPFCGTIRFTSPFQRLVAYPGLTALNIAGGLGGKVGGFGQFFLGKAPFLS